MALALDMRNKQQQNLVDKIYQEIQDQAKAQPKLKEFIVEVTKLVQAMALNLYLVGGVFDDLTLPDVETLSPAQAQALSIFAKVAEFNEDAEDADEDSRIIAEAGLLLARLLEKLQADTIGKFESRWSREFHEHNPKTETPLSRNLVAT